MHTRLGGYILNECMHTKVLRWSRAQHLYEKGLGKSQVTRRVCFMLKR